MLDTVNLWLPQDTIATSTLQHLDNVNEHANTRTGEYSYSGYAGNYKVSVWGHGVSFKGSLAKHHFGDNFHTLTRSCTQQAIENLSDSLHLDIAQAQVQRVDIASNLIMKHEHKAYYALLGDCQKLQRLEQPKSIYYNSTNKQLIFYNKIAEGKAKRVAIPECIKDKNVLRYEFRFLKQAAKQLKIDHLSAQMLYDESTYMHLIDHWYDHYKAITKNRIYTFAGDVMNDAKLFEKQLIMLGVQKLGGTKEVLQMIEQAKAQGKFDNRAQPSRLKKKLQSLNTNECLTQESELITELDKKVRQAKAFYR